MIRSTRRTQGRRMTVLLMAALLVMISCSAEESVEDKPVDDTRDAPGIEADAETETGPENRDSSWLEGDEIQDPAHLARIDLLNRDATDSIVRAADFLAEQARFRVVADVSVDVLQSDGRLLEFGASRDVTIRRPDRVRMNIVRRDGDASTLYFDGSTISIDLPAHRAFVREERPGTLYAALEYLSDDLGVPVPLANLFSVNFASPLEDQIGAGYFVGRSDVGGRSCEHLAFRLPEVDVQLWIEEGDRPLLARIVITHKLVDGNPQFRATFRDWDLEPETPESLFHFEPDLSRERLVMGSSPVRESPAGEEVE